MIKIITEIKNLSTAKLFIPLPERSLWLKPNKSFVRSYEVLSKLRNRDAKTLSNLVESGSIAISWTVIGATNDIEYLNESISVLIPNGMTAVPSARISDVQESQDSKSDVTAKGVGMEMKTVDHVPDPDDPGGTIVESTIDQVEIDDKEIVSSKQAMSINTAEDKMEKQAQQPQGTPEPIFPEAESGTVNVSERLEEMRSRPQFEPATEDDDETDVVKTDDSGLKDDIKDGVASNLLGAENTAQPNNNSGTVSDVLSRGADVQQNKPKRRGRPRKRSH